MNKSDTILVTGAQGLVGSAVAEHLRDLGFSVVVGVGRDDCDLLSPAYTRALFEHVRPAHVFHGAARVYGIMGNMNHQGQSYLENTLINTNVIDAAHRVGVKKITVMGTNAAYPFPPVLPFKESTIFDGRPHPSESGYAHAKRGMIAMLEAYQQSYGMEWACLVACNQFGARDKFDPVDGHVVPSLIVKFYDAWRTRTPVVVWGDGSARRDFMYVKDTARIAHLVMEKGAGAINAAAESRTIREVVKFLSDITGVTMVEWDSTKPNGQAYRAADLGRLAELGFRPAYTVKAALEETWNWYVRSKS